MWTYLAILAGVLAIAIVFAKRAILFFRTPKEEPVKTVSLEEEIEEESSDDSPKKLPKEEREKLEELFQKAEHLLNSGQEDEAIKLFVQVLAIDENHTETEKKLAMLYLQKQMYGAAAALFEHLASQENDPVHYSHLGLALYQQNEFEGSKRAYQKAIVLDDSRPQRYISLAQVYRSMGLNYLAIIAIKKALEREEENIDFLFLLSEVLLEEGKMEAAKAVLLQILQIEKENEEALRLIRKIEREQKMAEKEK